MGPRCQGEDGEKASVGYHGQAAVSCTTDPVDPEDTGHGGGSRHIFVVPLLNFPGLSFQLSIVRGSGSGYYHSSTPADYCMTGAGHRLLSPFTLNPAY